MDSIINRTDSYKVSQWKAYPEGMTQMQSYLESRGGPDDEVVFFGLQYIIKKYLLGVQVTREAIDYMESFFKSHFGRDDVFNKEGWEYILENHGGVLPIEIRAVAEGTPVPVKNALMVIENTDPKCAWLVNYLETLLSKVWYSTTIATRGWNIRKSVLKHLEKSGTPEAIEFKVVDFGYRGVSTEEQAGVGGLAFLISSMATDNLRAIIVGQEYYGAGMSGFSIPATEHSVMTALGRGGELEQCRRFLTQYPAGMIACVSDTYNIYECTSDIWGGELKGIVEERDGILVIRPDSGDFFEVIPKLLEILAQKFGYTVNSKGYKVLSDKVRLIQGDGMKPKTIDLLYAHIVNLGWSADNLSVGSGGGLLMEDATRDLHKFAMKACWALINGIGVDLVKDPITDPGKASKKGRLKLIKNHFLNEDGTTSWKYDTINHYHPLFNDFPNELELVLRNGELFRDQLFAEVRTNSQ